MRIALIPARGGSRRIPRKNIRDFFGIPIMARSILTAERSQLFDHVFVSTDDGEIAGIAERYGASVIVRPPALGDDAVGTQEVVRHALIEMHQTPDEVCCIYPTAPTMSCVDLILAQRAMQASGRYCYVPGWLYWGIAEWFVERRPLSEGVQYPIERERYVDINDEADWQTAEAMYRQLNHPRSQEWAQPRQ